MTLKPLSAWIFPLLLALMSLDARADIAQKKLFIKDCAKAKESVALLKDEERDDFVRFLSLLIKQRPNITDRTQFNPIAPVGKIQPFESPLDETASGELFQLINPEHETKAKLCALDALEMLTPHSFAAVPAMLEVSSDIAIATAVRDRIPALLVALSQAAARAGAVDPQVLRQITRAILEPYGELARNVLLELGDAAVEALFDEFTRPDKPRRDLIATILVRTKPSSDVVLPQVTELLNSAEPDLRLHTVQLLGRLRTADDALFAKILETFGDLEPDVQDGAIRAVIKVANDRRLTPEKAQQAFSAAVELLSTRLGAARDVPTDMIKAVTSSLPDPQASLAVLLKSDDDDLVYRALGIVESQIATLTPQTAEAVRALLPNASERVLSRAMSVVAKPHADSRKTADSIVELISTREKGPVSGGKERLAHEGMRALSLLSPGYGSKIIPVAFRYLPQDADVEANFISSHAAALFLKGFKKEIVGPLLKILRDPKPTQLLAAARLAAVVAPSDKQVIEAAVSLLKKDGQSQAAAYEILVASGKSANRDLQTVVASKIQGNARRAAAKILAMNEAKDPIVLSTLLSGLPSQDCRELGSIVPLIARIQGGVSHQLFMQLLGCFKAKSLPLDQLATIAETVRPLDVESKLALLDVLKSQESDRFLRLKIIELAGVFELPAAEMLGILLEIARGNDSSLSLLALRGIRALGTNAQAVVPKILDLARNGDFDPIVRSEAALVASELSPNDDGYVDYFVREVKSDRSEWALSAMKRLEPQALSKVIERGYEKFGGESKREMIRMIARLPKDDALRFSDALYSAADQSRDPLIALDALVTLLRINPAHPGLEAHVRRTLIGAHREYLMKESFDEATRAFLETLLPQATSRLERLGLESLVTVRK